MFFFCCCCFLFFFKQLDAGALIPKPHSTFKDCEGARICMNTASVYSTENRRWSVRYKKKRLHILRTHSMWHLSHLFSKSFKANAFEMIEFKQNKVLGSNKSILNPGNSQVWCGHDTISIPKNWGFIHNEFKSKVLTRSTIKCTQQAKVTQTMVVLHSVLQKKSPSRKNKVSSYWSEWKWGKLYEIEKDDADTIHCHDSIQSSNHKVWFLPWQWWSASSHLPLSDK